MRCLSCGTNHTLKERVAAGGRCRQCRHTFAFEPTEMDNRAITDRLFAAVLQRISVNGTLFFSGKQLFYGLQATLDKKSDQLFQELLGKVIILLLFSLVPIILPFGLLLWIHYPFLQQAANARDEPLELRLRKITIVQWTSALEIGVGVLGLLLFPAKSFLLAVFYLLAGGGGLVAALHKKRRIKPSQEFRMPFDAFLGLLRRWSAVNGTIPSLLMGDRSSLVVPEKEPAPPWPARDDVEAYSFDRLIVCDRPEIVQFLLANHFHFEHNCAILAIGGYPREIFATTYAMVKRNPSLKVYALHDCSPHGLRVAHQLRTDAEWFADDAIPIVDLGLLPRQVRANSKQMFIRQDLSCQQDAKRLPSEIRQALSPEDLAWLEEGYFVELESIPPQRLLRILRHGLLQQRELDTRGESESTLIAGAVAYESAESFG